MSTFITKDNNRFPISPPSHPAIISAKDVHDRQPSKKLLAMKTKKFLEGANKLRVQAKERREQKLRKMRFRVDGIVVSNQSDNAKIESLQRLLNNHYKEMDEPLVERIRKELRELHENNEHSNEIDHTKRLQKESEQNKKSEPDIPFQKPLHGTEPKEVGRDHNTKEIIYDDDSRQPYEDDSENDNIDDDSENDKVSNEVKYATEAIRTQVS